MKVAQIAPGFVEVPPQRGGAVENHIVSLSRELEYLACEVKMLARYGDTRRVGLAEPPHQRSRIEQSILPLRAMGILPYCLRLRRHLADTHYDVVHFHGGIAGLVQSSLVARSDAKRILTVHNSLLFSENAVERSVAAITELTSASKVDAVIAVSKSMKRVLERKVKRGIVCYIPNGVDLVRAVDEKSARHRLGLDGRIVLFVGCITPRKGVHVLIESFRAIVENRGIRDIKLVLVGPGSDVFGGLPSKYFYAILDRVQELKEYAVYMGNVSDDVLRMLYASADLLVLPSLADAMPIVLLEAMAYGKPVVATNVGGIPDAVEHMKTGVLVSPGNSTALADAIGQVLEDEVLMKRMSRNAREKVEKEFSWAKVAEQVKSLYEQLIAESLAR